MGGIAITSRRASRRVGHRGIATSLHFCQPQDAPSARMRPRSTGFAVPVKRLDNAADHQLAIGVLGRVARQAIGGTHWQYCSGLLPKQGIAICTWNDLQVSRNVWYTRGIVLILPPCGYSESIIMLKNDFPCTAMLLVKVLLGSFRIF